MRTPRGWDTEGWTKDIFDVDVVVVLRCFNAESRHSDVVRWRVWETGLEGIGWGWIGSALLLHQSRLHLFKSSM